MWPFVAIALVENKACDLGRLEAGGVQVLRG
jgi:hypothetical protein